MDKKLWEKQWDIFLNSNLIGFEIVRPAPQITYKKWWHRFLPHYRKKIKLMNLLIRKDWDSGLRKKVEEEINNYILYGSPRPTKETK